MLLIEEGGNKGMQFLKTNIVLNFSSQYSKSISPKGINFSSQKKVCW